MNRAAATSIALKDRPINKAILLRNVTCVYCGITFDDQTPSTNEHVIGRRFVPKGTLANQWNLIANACKRCNREKANLEDDLSAITMYPGPDGRLACDDPRLAAEACRKAKGAMSRRTGKPVGSSSESFEIKGQFGPATFTFNMIGPPQANPARVYDLAEMHVQAFFYLITFDEQGGFGQFMPGVSMPLVFARRTDWGNSVMRGFMQLMNSWAPRVLATGADGFFRIRLCRHPEAKDVWAWALEWNRSHRVIGLFGDQAEAQAVMAALPKLHMKLYSQGMGEVIRCRLEEPLPPDEDNMFSDL